MSDTSQEFNAITCILETYNAAAYDGAWASIDATLESVNFENLSNALINAHLRGSFAMRVKLKKWEDAAIRARDVIVAREGTKKAQAVLKGLPIPQSVKVVMK